MLVVKYTKRGAAAYLGHLDVLNYFQRVFRRGGIPVEFSGGFHPHMLIYFSAPLGVGISSESEYCAVATSLSPEEFLTRFNAVTTPDIVAVAAYHTDKNPNLAAIIAAGEYRIAFEGEGDLAGICTELSEAESLEIHYVQKGKAQSKDYKAELLSLRAEGDSIVALLRHGQINLRADRLSGYIEEKYHLSTASILRIGQYTQTEQGLIPLEKMFEA